MSWLPTGKAELVTAPGLDRYGRRLSTLLINGRDVAEIAIEEGWGAKYSGKGMRPDWCARIREGHKSTP